MKRLFAGVLLAALAAAQQPDQQTDHQSLFSQIGAMEQALTEITGLRFKHSVPYALIDKVQLRQYIEDKIKETVKPADVHAEEIVLKLLGLVPADFDLRKNTLDLLTEQAAAFYDYNKKKLFILEDGTGAGADQEMELVHELSHALADQHFTLAKYVSAGLRSDDAATARQAVMEGQATWLMTAYISRKGGGPAEVPDAILDLMAHSVENNPSQYPVLFHAPPYIRESLIFPYADGLVFQNALFKKMGRASFAEVFRHPPVSTQQIIHPDLYLAHQGPQIPRPPPIPAARDFRMLAEGTLGELDYRILLSQYGDQGTAAALASHLAGGSYQLFENKRNGFPVLAYASVWDTPESAARVFEQYPDVLRGKWKNLQIQSQTATRVEGRGDAGYFRVWLDGAAVNHLEGWKSPLP
jgi:hypothetical protein